MRNLGKVINNKDIATKEYVDNHGGESLPVGSEIDYDGNDIPTGWEQINGTSLVVYTLYEDTTGTLENVMLSDNVENYDYIEIYYRTAGRSGSIKVEDITNKTLTLPFTITARNTLVILAKAITISSNIITDGGEFQYMKSTNGESYSELDTIYIYKVLGYKEG